MLTREIDFFVQFLDKNTIPPVIQPYLNSILIKMKKMHSIWQYIYPPNVYAYVRRENPFTAVSFPGAAVKQIWCTTQLMFYNSLFVDISSQFIMSKSQIIKLRRANAPRMLSCFNVKSQDNYHQWMIYNVIYDCDFW